MARLVEGAGPRLSLALVLAFGGTALGVLALRGQDRLLAVEDFAPQIQAAAREAGIEPWLLAGLVYTESRGDPEARSSIGALGLCQLHPETAAEMAARLGLGDPPWTPAENLRMGAHYLAGLLDRFGSDLDLALLAYRLGPGTVARALREAGGRDAWIARLRGERSGPWEYRTQVLRFTERFRERAGAGIGWPAAEAGEDPP